MILVQQEGTLSQLARSVLQLAQVVAPESMTETTVQTAILVPLVNSPARSRQPQIRLVRTVQQQSTQQMLGELDVSIKNETNF